MGRGRLFAFKFRTGGVSLGFCFVVLWISSSTWTVVSVWRGSKAKELAKAPSDRRGGGWSTWQSWQSCKLPCAQGFYSSKWFTCPPQTSAYYQPCKCCNFSARVSGGRSQRISAQSSFSVAEELLAHLHNTMRANDCSESKMKRFFQSLYSSCFQFLPQK